MKVYLLDSNSCYAGAADIDPWQPVPKCVVEVPPDTIYPEIAQWFDKAWRVLPSMPDWTPPPQPPEVVQADIVIQTQARLDTFAMTRNYDSILSACTYATSPTVKFKTEGQYAVQARDATWAALYTILAEVQAGTRPMPSGYADIESELPALVWPV